MNRIRWAGLVAAVLVGGLAIGYPRGASSTAAMGTHALLAPFNDPQLTERAGSVLRGEVIASEIMLLKDDPDLPTSLSAAGKQLVDSGMAHVKWHVRVTEWLKGSGPDEIIIVQAHSGSTGNTGALVEIEDPAQELFGALTHDQITAGNTYTFWLDKYDWFEKNYYVLARAKTSSL